MSFLIKGPLLSLDPHFLQRVLPCTLKVVPLGFGEQLGSSGVRPRYASESLARVEKPRLGSAWRGGGGGGGGGFNPKP